VTFVDPDHVSLLLDGALTSVNAALTTAGRPVARVVRFPGGPPSWDCEMLAAWPRLTSGGIGTQPNQRIMHRAVKHVLTLNILLLRCTAAVNEDTGLPSAIEVDADGDAYATDMWVLHRTLVLGCLDGTLFAAGSCSEAHSSGVLPQAPQGGLSAMTSTIEVTL